MLVMVAHVRHFRMWETAVRVLWDVYGSLAPLQTSVQSSMETIWLIGFRPSVSSLSTRCKVQDREAAFPHIDDELHDPDSIELSDVARATSTSVGIRHGYGGPARTLH